MRLFSGVITVLEKETHRAEKRARQLKQAEWVKLRIASNDKGIAQVINDLSNPLQSAWEARPLPLSYARSLRYAVLASVYTAIPTYCPVAVLSDVYDSLRDRMKHESNWHLAVPGLLHTVSKRHISPPLDSLMIKARSYSLTKHDGRLTNLPDVS